MIMEVFKIILAIAAVLIPAILIMFVLLKTGILDRLSGATGCFTRLIIFAVLLYVLVWLTSGILAKLVE